MATTESAIHANTKLSILELLTRPLVDKIVALIAISPFAYDIVTNYKSYHFEIPSLAYLADVLILVGTMLFRRVPVRVTPNPWFWLLTESACDVCRHERLTRSES